jgi:hypothetical protein
MEAKLNAVVKRCKKRGGDCPCIGRCQALDEVDRELGAVSWQELDLKQKRKRLEDTRKRLTTKPATLRDDFHFDPNLQPVIVFDGDEAIFGYEDEDGEWIEQNTWPFNEDHVWPDDCERLGFRIE